VTKERSSGEVEVQLACLGDKLSRLRLCEPADVAIVQRSLEQQGQLSTVLAFDDAGQFEVIDGFKRLGAARNLGWNALRVRVAIDCDELQAKVWMCMLHTGRGLTELEEAWLVRSLYREHRLGQPQIALRLRKHKSWVCRRLMLAESLHQELQARVRLGLLVARTATELSRLSRDNQVAAGDVVVRRGLTVRQTQLLVAQLLECRDQSGRDRLLSSWMQGEVSQSSARPLRKVVTEADRMSADIMTVHQTSARLQARLLASPPIVFGPQVGELLVHALEALRPVLRSLDTTIGQSLNETKDEAQ
jgi:ParB-like chromosome segregation protein Spo0J